MSEHTSRKKGERKSNGPWLVDECQQIDGERRSTAFHISDEGLISCSRHLVPAILLVDVTNFWRVFQLSCA